MKTLVIAEKPSVAADIARALGKVPKHGDVFENDEWVISSAIGHLVELFMPEDIDAKKYGYWRLETLPIIPEQFGLKPIEKSKERFQLLKKLIARKDVGAIINACDAGREGELIFDYIVRLAKAKQPIRRLWMSSMTADGIRTAFQRLRTAEEMRPLADAARSRSEADWLIGINGTRAVTKRLFGSRKGSMATVGRVQTPTLAIVMQREREIRAFRPRPFHRVVAQFQVAAGAYEGVYQRPDFKKSDDEHDRAERLWERAAAEAVAAALARGARAAVADESKRTTQISPRLFDLTSLQREANNRFSFPARKTLQIAQALYERHKMITYPRTDSRALPEDYPSTVRATLARLGGDLAAHARTVLDSGWVRPNKRIFNNAEVTDHFAIIPTDAEAKDLDGDERKIFDLIARRFVAVFFPPAQIDVTTRTSTVAGHAFKSEGKVLVEPGYLVVAGRTGFEDGAKKLPALGPADGQPAQATVVAVEVTDEATKPPPRYTEATLLSAMENAGKFVDDEDLADAMSERGLGTPATRAAIIEHLLAEKYLTREQRELAPTPKAETVLDFLATAKVDELTKPALTGEWEFQLRKVEHGQLSREEFMSGIVELTRRIVGNVKDLEETPTPVPRLVSFTDGRPMLEYSRWWEAQDKALRVYRTVNGRRLTEDDVAALLRDREIGPFDDFVSEKSGKRYTAKLKVVPNGEAGTWKTALDLGQDEAVADLTPVWRDPATGRELCETATHYLCRTLEGGSPAEVFRMGRIVCRYEVPREQVQKLIAEGRTDAIQHFVSRFGKNFTAFLKLDLSVPNPNRRIVFEFLPRERKAPKEGEAATPARRKAPPLDLSGAESIGPSPVHEGELLRTADLYVVRKPPGAADGRVVFKMNRQLCGKEVPVDQVRKLLEDGRTDLIEGFTSKTGRPFDAFLVLAKNKARSEFEFPAREGSSGTRSRRSKNAAEPTETSD
jgi:DNA topoisomerase-3